MRRARRWFWGLTVLAILAVGALSWALTADPSPATGLQVAGSGLVLAVCGALATRILLALTGTTRRSRRGSAGHRGGRERKRTVSM